MESDEVRHRRCASALARHGQQHVLRWWDDLPPEERQRLLSDVESIPWDRVAPLIESHVRNKPVVSALGSLAPAPCWPPLPGETLARRYAEAASGGEEMIRAGRVAALTVAGGQGSRLGFDGPKGSVTVSPIREKSLFQLIAELIAATGKRHAVPLRWYIMTSPANHQQTLDFFEAHDYFGLPRDGVTMFSQGLLPSFDLDGRILMAERHRLAMAPDGHGGTFAALVKSGAIDDMVQHGVDTISYFQVDNPLVKPFDPLFLGLHDQTSSEMSAKVSRKSHALEKVGNLCSESGRTTVIEYSDLPDELAHALNADGSRKFDLGNLAIHLLNVEFAKRLGSAGDSTGGLLPYHRAEKAIRGLDANGTPQTPTESNGVKLETFVFDALPLAKNPLLLEVDRSEEFSPVKNATGEASIETAEADQLRRAASWLEAAGISIPRDANGEPEVRIEIAASYALDADDVKRRMADTAGKTTFASGESVYLS